HLRPRARRGRGAAPAPDRRHARRLTPPIRPPTEGAPQVSELSPEIAATVESNFPGTIPDAAPAAEEHDYEYQLEDGNWYPEDELDFTEEDEIDYSQLPPQS